MNWILLYYNSLPDMPKGCPLFTGEILHKDFFKCNPYNTDHHLYPKFETLAYDEGCHKRALNSYLNRDKDDLEKYALFYTCHTDMERNRKNVIAGYFKVGKQHNGPLGGFIACQAILLPKKECIEIKYSARGVPVSWGNSRIKEDVNIILKRLIKSKLDISEKYQRESRRITNTLQTKRGRKWIIGKCEKCKDMKSCYWGKKEGKEKLLNELYAERQTCQPYCSNLRSKN